MVYTQGSLANYHGFPLPFLVVHPTFRPPVWSYNPSLVYFPAYDGLKTHRSLPIYGHSRGLVSILRLILISILSDGTARPCTGLFCYCFGVTPPFESVFHPFLACYRPVRVPTLFVLLFGIVVKACPFGGSHHLFLSRATEASTTVVL